MRKKILMLFALVCIVLISTSTAKAEENVVVNTDNIKNGIVSVTYKPEITKSIKVQISKGSTKYLYDVKSNEEVFFPLQSGAGAYNLMVLENISGTSFRVVLNTDFTADSIDEKKMYSQSIQLINFNNSMKSVKDLTKLMQTAENDTEKFLAIYEYVVDYISYDNEKLAKLSSDYLPVIDDTYKTSKGICFDYASLLASILRANGIPCKLTMGYTEAIKGYHAWNQVLLDGKWVTVDTTYDAAAKKYKMEYRYTKDKETFSVIKQY